MSTTTTQVEAMLTGFQQAWSSQDTDAVLDFFADKLDFEDLPMGFRAQDKTGMREILEATFTAVPDFKMTIVEHHVADDGVVVTKWRQTGTMTAQGNGLDLREFPYKVITTSIIKLNADGLITSVSDNWNAAVLYQ